MGFLAGAPIFIPKINYSCSKTKLGPELDKIKLLVENGYPTGVLLSCINQKLANFAAEETSGPEKCPVYLKFPLDR